MEVSSLNVKQIMVVGAGQMGSGIAQVCAQSGYEVVLYDQSEEAMQRGIEGIHKLLTRAVEKERMTEQDKQATIQRLQQAKSIEDAREVDIVIEAAVESIAVKKEIFTELDQIAPKHTIFATNTSSLPITEVAAATTRPEKVIGMHFMNSVPIMKLVEVIRGLQTADETYQEIADVANN